MRWQCAVPCTEQVWDVHGAAPDFRFPEEFVHDGDAVQVSASVALDSVAATTSFMALCSEHRKPPTCPHCGGPARPAVLLFGSDGAALYERSAQAQAWREWRRRAAAHLTADRERRLAIVEVGAGTDVPSVRSACEDLLHALGPRQCTLIRINPTPVTGDNSTAGVLMVKWNGEEAIACISACLDDLASDSEHEDNGQVEEREHGRPGTAEAPTKRPRGDTVASRVASGGAQ